MTTSKDTLEQIREELQETNQRELRSFARYVKCVKENHWQQRERVEMIEKLSRIHSPVDRWIVGTVLSALVFIGPILNDQVARAWSKAHDMQVTAVLRTKDFLTTLSAPKRYQQMYFYGILVPWKHIPKRYRQMYFNAMLVAWKHAIRLYCVALKQTWGSTKTVVFY
jgi:hypothetical protein